MPVEQKRKPQAERELEHGRDTRVPERVPDCGLENTVVPELREVAQSDKVAWHAHFRVGYREQYALHERIGNEKAQYDDRGQKQRQPKPALIFEQTADKCLTLRGRPCGYLRDSHRNSWFAAGQRP